MIVIQVTRVNLVPEAEDQLSKRAYDRAVDWMSHWTPRANFKAILAESRDEGVELCRKQLQKELVPGWMTSEHGVSPKHFMFQVSYDEVTDGQFWPQFEATWIADHRVIQKEV